MSDPIDARFLREMVRELSSEEPKPVDWDRVEEKLFARLEDEGAPGSGALPSLYGQAGADEPDGASEDRPEDERFGDRFADGGLGERISEVGLDLTGERISIPQAPAAYVVAHEDRPEEKPRAVLHVPGVGGLGRRFDDGPGWSSGDAERRARAPGRKKVRAAREGARTLSPARPEMSFVRRHGGVAAMVAAAACFAFLLGGLVTGGLGRKPATSSRDTTEIVAERWVDPADVPMAPGMAGAHDLGALRAGDMIEATAGAVSFAKADKVSWTLSPGSRVFVRSAIGDPRHVLVLESGSIRAEVLANPSGVVDPFVVEAGDTRVAVQDTLFSVTRSTRGLMVDVERGLVVVGPREELGLGSGRLVHPSEGGVFSLDGGRTFTSLAPERAAVVRPTPVIVAAANGDASTRQEVAVSPGPARGPSDAPAPSPAIEGTGPGVAAPVNGVASPGGDPAKSPAPPSADPSNASASTDAPQALLREGAIRGTLDRCFAQVEAKRRSDAKSDEVALTMRSTLRLRVADDGSIKAASFNPPLRSDLQACAVGLLSSRLEGGARTIDVPVEIKR